MKNAMDVGPEADEAGKAVEHALRTIGILFEPGDVIEIRALNVNRTGDSAGVTCSGYFNFENETAIRSAIQYLNGKAEGVYVVLNRFNPALLARADNRLQARPKNTTSDQNIQQRRWLYVDVDACRPAGISATAGEHDAALQRTHQIREFLRSLEWPEPIVADSGNGGHLLYLLPPLGLTQAADIVKGCLKALASRFSDETVTVDEATASAARICKLYGTWARKGDSTLERPHRPARILDEPERIEAVPVKLLESLATEGDKVVPSSTRRLSKLSPRSRFDLEEWLASGGLDVVKGPDPYQGGRRWTLRTCPFNPDHKAPVIIEFPSGALCYKCLHTSCAQNDWRVLRKRIEPSYRDEEQLSPSRNIGEALIAPAKIFDDPTRLITHLSQIPSVWTLEANLEWCVKEMIAQGSVTLICAESGVGKTWLAYYIAGCVARGTPVIGRRAKQNKVLYLDGENPLYVVKQRLRDLGIAETPDLTIWGGWNSSSPPAPSDPLVVEFAREHSGLIIYDSLIEFHPGSEQSSTETRAFMRHFRALANLGATVIVLHNAGKAETAKLYRGSSDIKAAVDTAYLLCRPDDSPGKLGKLHMKCFKGRLMPGQDFGMEFREKEGFARSEIEVTRTVPEIISEILDANRGSNQKQIVTMAREEGCSKRQAEECLKHGNWKKTRGPKNSILYSLPAEADHD